MLTLPKCRFRSQCLVRAVLVSTDRDGTTEAEYSYLRAVADGSDGELTIEDDSVHFMPNTVRRRA